MTKDEALKLALEALRDLQRAYRDAVKLWDSNHDDAYSFKSHNAIANLRQALAQPVQDPRNVRERWNIELDGNDLLVCFNDHEKGDACQYERYSPQRTWVGLTNEQIEAIWRRVQANDFHDCVQPFARAIEAAHGIKGEP